MHTPWTEKPWKMRPETAGIIGRKWGEARRTPLFPRGLYRQPAADEDSQPAPHPPAPEPTRYRPAAARVRGAFQGGES